MKIVDVEVSNFRGLTYIKLQNLGSGIVIAGPNGCGKSCLLETLRGLKSAYGSYEQDEWAKWCQEYGIDLNGQGNIYSSLFQNKEIPVVIRVVYELKNEEKKYMHTNLKDLLRNSVWSQNMQPHAMMQPQRRMSLAENLRNNDEQLAERLAQLEPLIKIQLSNLSTEGKITIQPSGQINILINPLLEFIFATFDASHLGIIDYYGANRRYNRSGQAQITQASNNNQQRRQNALYGLEKTNNLKSEMTGVFISKLLASTALQGLMVGQDDPLTQSLKELFVNFFPGKEFLGPTPTVNGTLAFPVKLANGAIHDLDELSSGEKEIVYGYLRIYSDKHRNSVIIIDEPELHLNPRLTSGLVAFYYKYLAADRENQIWLVTHSDSIIRDALSHPEFQVYHFQSAQSSPDMQATLVSAESDSDKLIYDLVGDMAAYRPGAEIVVLESTKDIEFDRRMLERLFPEFSQRVNYISAGGRDDVARVHNVLESARNAGLIHAAIYAIGDKDSDQERFSGLNRYVWDVYHIENYLLSPRHVLKTLLDSNSNSDLKDEAAVWLALRECAIKCIPEVVSNLVRGELKKILANQFNFGLNNDEIVDAEIVSGALDMVQKKLDSARADALSTANLQGLISSIRGKFEVSLQNDEWSKLIPGRKILKRFVDEHGGPGVGYAGFVQWILTSMVSDGHKPIGMMNVLRLISPGVRIL